MTIIWIYKFNNKENNINTCNFCICIISNIAPSLLFYFFIVYWHAHLISAVWNYRTTNSPMLVAKTDFKLTFVFWSNYQTCTFLLKAEKKPQSGDLLHNKNYLISVQTLMKDWRMSSLVCLWGKIIARTVRAFPKIFFHVWRHCL